jgi:hypothetical protein
MKEVKGREARLALVADLTDVLQRNDLAQSGAHSKNIWPSLLLLKRKDAQKGHRRHISPLLGDDEIGGPTEAAVDRLFWHKVHQRGYSTSGMR